MQRVVLIYNPASGWQNRRVAEQIETVAAVLRGAGVSAEAVGTGGPGQAGRQAKEAARAGFDTVLACGGDGTVNEVLQGIVGTGLALGVIPLGTANALATDLGLPSHPEGAARMLLTFAPFRIAAGRISYCRNGGSTEQRYFTVAAGIGPDAHLMYQLNVQLKRRLGYSFYFAQAVRTWATHSYPLFHGELNAGGNGNRRGVDVSQVLAVRISNFGGMLRRLAPGAALQREDLRLVLFKTRSRASYLWYMLAVLCGLSPRVPDIELADAVSIECRAADDAPARVYVEADGEALGNLPCRIEIVPDAVTLLMKNPE
jgi:YegS/Rv2252/BmrU family lipid kinase